MRETLARGFVFGFGFMMGYAVATAVIHQIEWNAKAQFAESITESIRDQHRQHASSN